MFCFHSHISRWDIKTRLTWFSWEFSRSRNLVMRWWMRCEPIRKKLLENSWGSRYTLHILISSLECDISVSGLPGLETFANSLVVSVSVSEKRSLKKVSVLVSEKFVSDKKSRSRYRSKFWSRHTVIKVNMAILCNVYRNLGHPIKLKTWRASKSSTDINQQKDSKDLFVMCQSSFTSHQSIWWHLWKGRKSLLQSEPICPRRGDICQHNAFICISALNSKLFFNIPHITHISNSEHIFKLEPHLISWVKIFQRKEMHRHKKKFWNERLGFKFWRSAYCESKIP